MLVLPALAIWRLAASLDARYPWGYFIAISLITYLIYRSDKRRAIAGERRTPESGLHFLELIGGWPGAFLAQRLLRHKNAKVMYQVNFWAIVALHQLVFFDYLLGWRYVGQFLSLLR